MGEFQPWEIAHAAACLDPAHRRACSTCLRIDLDAMELVAKAANTLANNVTGILGLCADEVRHHAGNTNYRVLLNCAEKVKEALSQSRPTPAEGEQKP